MWPWTPRAGVITPANAQERAQVDPLGRQVQEATNQQVKIAFVDQGYTGQDAAELAQVACSETDFTEDLKKFDVPTLIIHGDDDQIVPIDASAKLVPGAQLKIYPGGTHSLGDTSKDQLNADLLAFAKG